MSLRERLGESSPAVADVVILVPAFDDWQAAELLLKGCVCRSHCWDSVTSRRRCRAALYPANMRGYTQVASGCATPEAWRYPWFREQKKVYTPVGVT